MEWELDFVHLHEPLFFARKNWGAKLDVNLTPGLEMVESATVEDGCPIHEIIVKYQKQQTRFSVLSAASRERKGEGWQRKVLSQVRPEAPPKGKVQAQVSTPMSHVFEGAGKGKAK